MGGPFDLFDPGAATGSEWETIAEVGGPGPGVFAPGSSSTFTIDLDPLNHRYMSFASMAIPSIDTFLANENPRAAELFDEEGNFLNWVNVLERPWIWSYDLSR